MRWGWACVLAALGSFPAHAEGPAELERLREAVASSRERVEKNVATERSLLGDLEGLDRRLARIDEDLIGAQARAAKAETALGGIEAERFETGERLSRGRAAMGRRVAALYKTGETGSLRVLFSSESPWDWLSRASTLRALIDYDRRLLASTLQASEDLRRMGQAAAVAAEERDRALEAVAGRHELLARERVEKRELLARVRLDGDRERALLSESESAARALESALERMSRQRGRAPNRGGLAARKGRLEAPVRAPVRAPFGRVTDPRFGTQTFRKGVEFDADRGVSVRAVALGEVRYADWFRGYGRIVILDHGEGYFSVYGHLDRIGVRVGQWVNESQAVGVVGDTGSLEGPGLYFELRRGSQPLDPSQWLVAR
ncbi:MAG: peptidoglycan DD-metalloendopeptidase family protein [Myxococcota bacterium]|nr:peptidoglycan DD-metalloendopeptidase family protein [Myxococcota bacterium]